MDPRELRCEHLLITRLLELSEVVDRLDNQRSRAARALDALRGAVGEALALALPIRQIAALLDLRDLLEWDPAGGGELYFRYRAAIEEREVLIRELAASQPLVQVCDAIHSWKNAASQVIEEDALRAACAGCLELLDKTAASRSLPSRDRLRQLLQRVSIELEPTQEGLRSYFAGSTGWLEDRARTIQADLGSYYRAVDGRAGQGRVRHVLVVEDDPGWKRDVELVAREAAAELGDLQVEARADCKSARSFVEAHEREGVLCLCDIGLPEASGEKSREENGWRLIAWLHERGCPLIALTSISRLDRSFAELGFHPLDFLLKDSGGAWKEDLHERLEAHFAPLPPARLTVTIPAFDAHRVLVGGVWVELKPMAFAVLDALAYGFPRDRPGLGLLPQFWEPEPVIVRDRPQALTLDGLKVVICAREISDLRADFMEKFGHRQMREHLNSIRAAVRETFARLGRAADVEGLIEVTDAGERGQEATFQYRLAAPARIYHTPQDFYAARGGVLRVLVVEDDPTYRRRIVRALQQLTTDLHEAASYEDALKIAPDIRPHLVTLDLNVPRAGVGRAEHGVELRRRLTELLGEVEFVVLTSHDSATLRRELMRLVPTGPGILASGGERITLALRRRIQARAIIQKQDGPAALDRLLIEAWRFEQERATGSCIPRSPGTPPGRIELAHEPWGLRIEGVDIAYTGDSAAADHGLLMLLASYANVPLRRQAILDHWAMSGMLDDIADPRQQLIDRIDRIRKMITAAGFDGKAILQEHDGGYALVGRVLFPSP